MLRYLRPNIIYSVPCDWIVQRSPTFLCFENPTALFASQHNLYRTMWPVRAKSLFHSFCTSFSKSNSKLVFFLSAENWFPVLSKIINSTIYFQFSRTIDQFFTALNVSSASFTLVALHHRHITWWYSLIQTRCLLCPSSREWSTSITRLLNSMATWPPLDVWLTVTGSSRSPTGVCTNSRLDRRRPRNIRTRCMLVS